MMRFIFLLLLNFNFNTEAAISSYEIANSQKFAFSIKEICNKTSPHNLLYAAKDINRFECMGKEMQAQQFCQKKAIEEKNWPKLHLLRGFVDVEKKEVVCQTGDRVYLKSRGEKKSCEELQQMFALQLPLQYSSKTGPDLSCHFFQPDQNSELKNKHEALHDL